MQCAIEGCPVVVKKVQQSSHWEKDGVCAYHAAKLYGERYPKLVKIIAPIVNEVSEAIRI